MLVTLKKQTIQESEVEIKLPYYFKVEDDSYALLDEQRAIRVTVNGDRVFISNGFLTNLFSNDIGKGVEITEDDFQFALGMAMERLSKFQTATV